MLIYKILRCSEWTSFENGRAFCGAPVDIADGFIHFSTASQVRETAAKHFADEPRLWLLAVAADKLGPDLRWEPSRGGALFPHLYRSLRRDEVLTAQAVSLGADGKHHFPEDLAETEA